MVMNISPRFFGGPGQGDYQKDMRYCNENGIDVSDKNRLEIKSSILSDMTGMNEEQAKQFYSGQGPLDRMMDLMLMQQLGLQPTGNREGNKTAITNALIAQKLDQQA